MKDIIQNYNLKELELLMERLGEKPFRAKQVNGGWEDSQTVEVGA
mgnify:CR=1 FL=1